jgi:histidinol-phosphate aminotransferase
MNPRTLSRRDFGRAVGAAAGAAILAPSLMSSATVAVPAADAPPRMLGFNENPYGPSPRALEAMTRAQAVAARYPDDVARQVAEAVARAHGVSTEQVLLGCGSTEILRTADMAFLGPGRKVLVAEPTYEAVLGYARVTNAEPVRIPLDADWRHDLAAMAAACADCVGLVYVCNPNNPTGTIVRRGELDAFFRSLPASATILVDEAYHHYVEDPEYASAIEWLDRMPNLIVVRTFSKIYGMAGLRLGYAVSSRENIARMAEHVTRFNVNAAVGAAALASLADAGHAERQRKLNNDARRGMCRELERDGRRYIPSETNFVMIHVGGDVGPVIERFRERGMIVGRKFPAMPEWLRISIGTREETELFVSLLREIVPARRAA